MYKIKLTDNKNKIIRQLKKMHEFDIAKLLRNYDETDAKYIISLIPIEQLDDVFLELSSKEAVFLFDNLTPAKQKYLLEEISAADIRDLFEELNEKDKERFLNLLSDEKKLVLETLLKYGDTVAGALMQNEFLSLKDTDTITSAMRHITRNVHDTDYIDKLFVTDENNKLVGKVYLKDLIIARKSDSFKDLIITGVIALKENEQIENVIRKISNYDLNVVPVVNDDNDLIGIIRADEAFEELVLISEDRFDKFVAVGDYDATSSVWKKAFQRMPWLLASIVLNLIIALFLTIFSNTIETVKALILFQPMILGMAGNIGIQSIGVTILKLHKNKSYNKKEVNKHIKREFLIAIFNSLLIAVIGFLLSFVFLEIAKFDIGTNIPTIHIAIVIGLALFLSMVLSAAFGVLIPIILDKMKIDPAIASGPIISTINDLVALAIYFGLASIMIAIIL